MFGMQLVLGYGGSANAKWKNLKGIKEIFNKENHKSKLNLLPKTTSMKKVILNC